MRPGGDRRGKEGGEMPYEPTPIISPMDMAIDFDPSKMSAKSRSMLRGFETPADPMAHLDEDEDGVEVRLRSVLAAGSNAALCDNLEFVARQYERAEERSAHDRKLSRLRKDREDARVSARGSFPDGDGSVWEFSVLDGEFARIELCRPNAVKLAVPAKIGGLPVLAIGEDILGDDRAVEEVVCPEGVRAMGSSAFRRCRNLRKIVLPAMMDGFSPSWLAHCDKLEEIVLPGLLDCIDAGLFSVGCLKRLSIGKAVNRIAPAAFEKSRLEHVEIDPANPYFRTDGAGIYTSDGKVLVALARPVERYEVAEGCAEIGEKALSGHGSLADVSLPESLVRIAPCAFMRTGVARLVAPSRLAEIGEKAFFRCPALHEVQLNDGLARIGEAAFADSALGSLRIPPTVEELGLGVAGKTNVVFAGPGCTFSVDPASPYFLFDGKGGLYRREKEGLCFVHLADGSAQTYEVLPGTVRIGQLAFGYHDAIESAVLPEGLESIGPRAFRACTGLRTASLPSTVRSIGREAFLNTSLEAIDLPVGLEELGAEALITRGARFGAVPPPLRSVTVAEGNKAFYVESGILCRHTPKGDHAVVYTDSEPDVAIPRSVRHIEPYAFGGARSIRSLSIGPATKTVDQGGLSVQSMIETLRIEVEEPVGGRTSFEFSFPSMERSIHEVSLALGTTAWIDLPAIFLHYDNCIANCHSFAVKRDDDLSAYEQAVLILGRLDDPIALTSSSRLMFDKILRDHLEAICVDIARHDDRGAMGKLVGHGYLNAGNIEGVLLAVRSLRDASMTGYLLELERLCFERDPFDYDL